MATRTQPTVTHVTEWYEVYRDRTTAGVSGWAFHMHFDTETEAEAYCRGAHGAHQYRVVRCTVIAEVDKQ